MTTPEAPAALALSVARIEVKLDQALMQHQDHEIRLRRLERALWTATGFAAAGGGAIGALVARLIGA